MPALIDRFIGHHSYSLDSKGRVSIPSEFREVMSDRYDERLVLMKFYDPCLVAYPMEEWSKLDEKVSALPDSDPDVISYKRYFYSSAKVCTLDRQGRILIPPVLKVYANLSREAVIIGQGNRMEIWDAGTWDEQSVQKDLAAVRVKMAKYGL